MCLVWQEESDEGNDELKIEENGEKDQMRKRTFCVVFSSGALRQKFGLGWFDPERGALLV